MKYGSVCAGIEAATVAWDTLGWEPAFFSEIDAFPCALLAHRYPNVPNFGDMTKFREWPDAAIDVLCGGTPCQAFSVAGLRKGLADPRGNLTLTYLAITERYRPKWLVWENVPGVLSDRTGAFGALLGGLAELGYGWAYRVLDAQYFGLAQRRKRVFVVGSSRGWAAAAAVLFERASLRGDPAPGREARERVAASLTSGSHPGSNAPERRREDDENLVTHSLRADGFDASEDGTGRGIPLIVGALSESSGHARPGDNLQGASAGYLIPDATPPLSHALNAGGMGRQDYETETLIAHALRDDGFDASEDGTGRGTPLVTTLAIRGRGGESTLETRDDGLANAILTPNGGRGGIGVGAVAFNARQDPDHWDERTGPLDTDGATQAVAFHENQRAEVTINDTAGALKNGGGKPGQGYSAVQTGMAVRRLTPRECERLQGFPDDYTAIPYRGKLAADGPRYKALGNSMAVPVMRWIGERIAMVSATDREDAGR